MTPAVRDFIILQPKYHIMAFYCPHSRKLILRPGLRPVSDMKYRTLDSNPNTSWNKTKNLTHDTIV